MEVGSKVSGQGTSVLDRIWKRHKSRRCFLFHNSQYMAGYFSNHSNQSRFLSNSSASQSSTTTTTHVPVPPSTTAGPPRSRVPSSKHFSTSLATSIEERAISKEKQSTKLPTSANGVAGVHPLRNTYVRNTWWRKGHYCVFSDLFLDTLNRWVFWFRQQRAPGNKIISYEEGIKKISACSSVGYDRYIF